MSKQLTIQAAASIQGDKSLLKRRGTFVRMSLLV